MDMSLHRSLDKQAVLVTAVIVVVNITFNRGNELFSVGKGVSVPLQLPIGSRVADVHLSVSIHRNGLIPLERNISNNRPY